MAVGCMGLDRRDSVMAGIEYTCESRCGRVFAMAVHTTLFFLI